MTRLQYVVDLCCDCDCHTVTASPFAIGRDSRQLLASLPEDEWSSKCVRRGIAQSFFINIEAKRAKISNPEIDAISMSSMGRTEVSPRACRRCYWDIDECRSAGSLNSIY